MDIRLFGRRFKTCFIALDATVPEKTFDLIFLGQDH